MTQTACLAGHMQLAYNDVHVRLTVLRRSNRSATRRAAVRSFILARLDTNTQPLAVSVKTDFFCSKPARAHLLTNNRIPAFMLQCWNANIEVINTGRKRHEMAANEWVPVQQRFCAYCSLRTAHVSTLLLSPLHPSLFPGEPE